jgi:VWFA-related protein
VPPRRWTRIALALAAASAAPSPAQPVEDAARFFEAIEVRRLELDVVVVGRDGEPVDGLEAADFEVRADGAPLELLDFEAHREVVAGPLAGGGAAGPGAGAAPAAPVSPVTWIVHVDQSRLRTSRRNAVLRQLGEFLEAELRPGDRTLVSTWDGDALRIVSRLSVERQGALDALAAIAGTPARGSPLEGAATALRSEINAVAPLSINITADKAEIRRRDAPPDTEFRSGTRVAAESLLRQIDALRDLEIARARAGMTALGDLLALAAGVEGRVGLLLVGGGYDAEVVDNLYRMWESRFASNEPSRRAGNPGAAAYEVAEGYTRLLESFAAGDAVVFTIAAGEADGFDVVETAGAGTALRGGSAATGAGGEADLSLAGLADATGGRTFAGGAGLAERLRGARAHLATFYTLGVRPPPAERPRLDVRVRRDGLRAVHRVRAAQRPTDELAAADAISALLESGSTATAGLAIEPGAAAAAKRGDAQVVPVTIRVPLAQLSLAPEGLVHRGSLAYYLAVERPDGGFVRLEPRGLRFEVPNAELEGSLGENVSFRIDVALAEGEHWLGVAVLDRGSGRRWSGAVPIEVARAR